MNDTDFMQVALAKARRGIGRTSPNPAVGAVIVSDGEILSTGWHRGAGQPHAEIEAIRALPSVDMARGATIYVTLEPCSTHGRTPPCVEAILRHGFARVVVGTTDPNPLHAGRGLDLLRAAGVDVKVGVLENECTSLNEGFNRWIVSGLPLVIAKSAMSLDGRITRRPGEGQWLTSPESRQAGHHLRASVDAILVGAETVRRDNPRLTVRGVGGASVFRQPWRVILSRSGQLPKAAHLFTDEFRERTLVFNDLAVALRELGQRQVLSVLIEGGGGILGSAFDQGLVDRVEFFYAPLLTGGDATSVAGVGVAHNDAGARLCDPVYSQIGPDLHLSARVQRG